MERVDRSTPLPDAMQGKWSDADEPASELIIEGGEVTCFDRLIEYDYKLISETDGALTVSLEVTNEADKDAFERSNITELVITPEGDLHAYNVRFASHFVRA